MVASPVPNRLPHFSLSPCPGHEQYGKPTFNIPSMVPVAFDVSLSFVTVARRSTRHIALFYLLRSLLSSDAFLSSDTHFSFYIYRSSMRMRCAHCPRQSERERETDTTERRRKKKNNNSDIMRFDRTGICDANIRDRGP